MGFLNPRQRKTLRLLCDTFIPSLTPADGEDETLFRQHASSLDVPETLEDALERATDNAAQRQLKIFLWSLEIGFINRLTAGIAKPFARMTLDERTQTLRWWADNPLMLARTAFQGLKRVTLALFYTAMPDDNPNPTWPAIRYSGPPNQTIDTPRGISPTIIHESTLSTDVLIIGSGAGGGVVAGELTAAGFDVMVIEKGGYRAEQDFHGKEMDSGEHLFEKFSLLATADTAMSVLAGSTLGGGTTVNWSASFRTPDNVLKEWASEYGFSGATSNEYQASLDAIMARINVNTDESIPNRNNAVLEQGCKALGYHLDVIPRNVKGCEECGFCGYGCPFGAKQGTLKTYLQDAYERGARIVVRAYVDRILYHNGVASGAQITITDDDGLPRKITVRAKAVVVAAGSIHTPALLLRSGLENAHIGANLHLHPVTTTFGVYDEPVEVWHGVPMSRFSREFANLDGHGYGVTIECAPAHPGICASALPWISGREHKRLMQKLHLMSNHIVLTRDFYGGQVKTDKQGNPVLDYKIHPHDARHLMRGTLESLRIHRAAGAKELCSPHSKQLMFYEGQNADFEGYLKRVEVEGFQPNAYALFSAHQMSSCRIGGSTALGALDPTGESYEVKNLFVADGSVLPTATGVNPMISIMGAAHYIAQHIKTKLGK